MKVAFVSRYDRTTGPLSFWSLFLSFPVSFPLPSLKVHPKMPLLQFHAEISFKSFSLFRKPINKILFLWKFRRLLSALFPPCPQSFCPPALSFCLSGSLCLFPFPSGPPFLRTAFPRPAFSRPLFCLADLGRSSPGTGATNLICRNTSFFPGSFLRNLCHVFRQPAAAPRKTLR